MQTQLLLFTFRHFQKKKFCAVTILVFYTVQLWSGA